MLNERRKKAVQMRLDGATLAVTSAATGLSNPTIIAAFKAFMQGGWAAVNVKPRGRPKDESRKLNPEQDARLLQLLCSALPESVKPGASLWQTALIKLWLHQQTSLVASERTLGRYITRFGLNAMPAIITPQDSDFASYRLWYQHSLLPLKQQAHQEHALLLWAGMTTVTVPGLGLFSQLYVHSPKGKLLWYLVSGPAKADDYIAFFSRVTTEFEHKVYLVLQGADIRPVAIIARWLANHSEQIVVNTPTTVLSVKRTVSPSAGQHSSVGKPVKRPNAPNVVLGYANKLRNPMNLTHLQRLEAESIHIMWEVVAEADNPVMLYSIGKDSAVMLHLAMKAFYPSLPPFPLLHVDTRFKFREMYTFRDQMVEKLGLKLLVYTNPEAIEKDISPFTHGSAIHTDVTKTEGLKQALDQYGFDAAFGGARRDEEKSRAKERIFSFRTEQHRWDPKNQRPELWKLYNARKHKGESIRVFPLSNWTELDIWQYIHLENIPIVPLYLAAPRPVVERDGTLIMVDDERLPLKEGEVPMIKNVRFRTLGCYPLTGAVESEATTLPEIIQEMLLTKTSERQGRMIDHDSAASMEKKKQEGYF